MNRNDSFSIHFSIVLANDSLKKAKTSQGIGIAIFLESESTQPYFEPREEGGQDVRVSLKINYTRMELKVTARISTSRRAALLCCRRRVVVMRHFLTFQLFSLTLIFSLFPSLSFIVRRTEHAADSHGAGTRKTYDGR